jgi:hypothetical protein
MPEEIDIRGEVLKMLDAEPFAFFQMVMASGDRYEITDRHQVAVGKNALVVFPPRETHSYLRLNRISSIDVSEPNGSKRRRRTNR